MLLNIYSFLGKWSSIEKEQCYGLMKGSYSTFQVPVGGEIVAIKLVYLSGVLSCYVGYLTKWGCGVLKYDPFYIS